MQPASAATYTQDLLEFINLEIKPSVNSDIVIDNLLKHNEMHVSLVESSLRLLDNNWHSEIRKIDQPLIRQIKENELSKFLMKMQEASHGVYTQITIIDAKGLNISQTVITENYWNIGKAIWDQTMGIKSYAPYISDLYYSDETSKFQVAVSFMIIADEQPIGIIAAGIDVEQLEEWKKSKF